MYYLISDLITLDFASRVGLALLTSFIFSLLLGGKMIKFLEKIQMQQSVRGEGPKSHLKKSGTPTMGGLLILLTLSLSTIFFGDLSCRYLWVCLTLTITFAALGYYDDLLKVKYKNSKGISAKFKFSVQSALVILAILICYFFEPNITIVNIPFIQSYNFGLAYFLWAILVVVGASNAVNLTDGLDGLAASQTVIVCLGLIAVATLTPLFNLTPMQQEVIIFLGALLGACLGFLWFNSCPAAVFMGDVGSLAIGGALGLSSLLLNVEIFFALMSSIFIAETLSVIIQVISFRYRKKRVFLMAPLHHHYELKGWSETKVVARFWIISFVLVLSVVTILVLR